MKIERLIIISVVLKSLVINIINSQEHKKIYYAKYLKYQKLKSSELIWKTKVLIEYRIKK